MGHLERIFRMSISVGEERRREKGDWVVLFGAGFWRYFGRDSFLEGSQTRGRGVHFWISTEEASFSWRGESLRDV